MLAQVFVHLLSPIHSTALMNNAHVRNNQMQGDRLNVGVEFAQEEQKMQKLLDMYAIEIS